MSRRETVERAAEQWAQELTDESGRNRLLYYRVLKRGTLELDQAVPSVRKRLLNGKKVHARALFPSEFFDDALRSIRAVSRKATSNYEEKGINTLFLGWGMATWTPVSSSATPAAPVLLCPVDLAPTGAAEVDFDIQLSGEWALNEALLQHLANEFEVDVSGENLDALAQHDLIAAIAGDEEAEQSLLTHRATAVEPSLPDRTPPESEFLVLDADSSQNEAINAALAGESFVLQGPPGTGKSQTISNLIAAMMANGKSVLFVAEKRAAIDAVAKRLTRVGLDNHVMDLHGGISSRKELARQLNQSLRDIGQTPRADQQNLHSRLQDARRDLSDHANALHQERAPWGRPAESLGVIAMGLHHANRIEESLRMRIEEENNPELEEFFKDSHEERAFVKNLERVQGDERDAIILSIGYGKNAGGKMLYRFGPLNQQGGERRLNVAITRARKRMTLVSSFDHADLDPERTKSTGAKMLRGFLKFAQSGGAELDGADEQQPLNPFEIDVMDKLTVAGLEVIPQYGCSGYRIDFAVCHPDKPGQFALAVEADGASYHSSPTARDRDRLRQEHLERLGWRFCRIWSADWFNDHRQEVNRVLTAYEQAVAQINAGANAPEVKTSPGSPEDLSSSSADTAPEAPPPRKSKPRIPDYSAIDEYSHRTLVAIALWVDSDGLLRTDRQLFDEIFKELPFERRGTKIEAAINAAIDSYRSQL